MTKAQKPGCQNPKYKYNILEVVFFSIINITTVSSAFIADIRS